MGKLISGNSSQVNVISNKKLVKDNTQQNNQTDNQQIRIIRNKTGEAQTKPTSQRKYVITGDKTVDNENARRISAGLDPIYNNVADRRNQLRLDNNMELSTDITPVMTQYHNYMRETDKKIGDLEALIQKNADRTERQIADAGRSSGVINSAYTSLPDANTRENAGRIDTAGTTTGMQNEIDRLKAQRQFASENLAMTLATMRGDAGLVSAYRDAYYTAINADVNIDRQDTGEIEKNRAREAAYLARQQMNDIVYQLKNKGYTEKDLQAFLNVTNANEMKQMMADVQEWAQKHPIVSTAASVATAPVRGLMGMAGMALDNGTKASPYNVLNEFSSTVQSTVRQGIEDGITKWGNETFGSGKAGSAATWAIKNAASMMYSAAVSSAESLLNMRLGGPLGELLMSSNAASSTYYEALDNGLSPGSAISMALTSGAFEAIFEHLSLENMRSLQASEGRGIKTLIKNTAKSFLTEGSEEVFTDIANEAYDYLFNGGLSEYERYVATYMEDHPNATRAEAEKKYKEKFLKQLGESMVIGGLSGAMHAGTYGIRNEVRGYGEDVRTGKALTELGSAKEGGVGEVLSPLTQAVGADSKAGKSLAKIDGETGNRKAGAAVRKAFDAVTETQKQVMDEALQDAGLENKAERQKLVNAYADMMLQGKGDADSLRTLREYKNYMPILNELIGTENTEAVMELRTNLSDAMRGRVDQQTERDLNTREIAQKAEETIIEHKTDTLVKTGYKATTADGATVETGAVKGIEDGKLQVVIDKESGATAKLDELTFEDAGGETLEKIQNMMTGDEEYRVKLSTDGANMMLALLNETDVDADKALQDLYNAYAKGSVLGDMDTMMRETGYDISTAAINAMYTAGAANYAVKPGVTRIGSAQLSKNVVDEIAAIDAYAKDNGLNIVVTDELYGEMQDSKGHINTIRMLGRQSGDVIVVSLQSGQRENVLSLTAFHETFHWLGKQGKLGARYQQNMIKSIIGYLKSSDKYDYDEIRQQRLDRGYAEDKVDEEIAAQFFGTILAEEAFRKYAAETDAPLWKKIIDHVKAFLENIRQRIEQRFAGDKAVQAALMSEVEDIRNFVTAFEMALADVNEARKNGEITQAETKDDYSFAGIWSETADMTMLEQAEQMEEEGYPSEAIRKETGWFRGYDRRWRYEIDNSDTEIDIDGLFMRNPEVRRYNELMQKFLYAMPTQEEIAEIKALEQNIKGLQMSPETLGDIMRNHDLFEAYPQLENIKIVIKEMKALGAYDTRTKTISINEDLTDNIRGFWQIRDIYESQQYKDYKKALADLDAWTDEEIEKIQDQITDLNNTEAGSWYWDFEIYSERDLDDEDRAELGEKEGGKKLLELLNRQNEIYEESENRNREIVDDFAKSETGRRLKEYNENVALEAIAKQSMSELKNTLIHEVQHAIQDIEGFASGSSPAYWALKGSKNPGEDYERTAGEIEARDASKRIYATKEQRKQFRPDIDRTDVVFADGGTANSEDLGGAEENIIKKSADLIDYSLEFAESGEHAELIEQAWTNDAAMPKSTVTERYDKIIDIWKKIGGELHSDFLNAWDKKTGKDRAFEIFKAQSGYKYNAELASMCKKGIALFDAIDVIVKDRVMEELGIKELGKHEKEILYDILKEHGHEIPCAICYVEQARQREGAIIRDFVNGNKSKKKLGWNEALDKIEEKMKAQGVEYRFTTMNIADADYAPADVVMTEAEQNAFYKAVYELVNEEITTNNKTAKVKRALAKSATPQAITNALKGSITLNMRVYKSLVSELQSRYRLPAYALYSSVATQNIAKANHELYKTFNMQGGVSGYKTKQTPVVYWGDILRMSAKPESVRKAGGIRWQSNSDSQMYTFLDRVQYFVDMTGKGYYHQEYTKVPASLKLFGLMGGKQNASLIPAVHVYRNADGTVDEERTRKYAGLDKDMNPIYDKVEGIDPDEAFLIATDREYSKNVGLICVGYSDEHIKKLLDDARISMIIGFHDKTDNPEKRYRGARYAHNYNGENEAKNAKGETVHVDFSKYLIKAENRFKKSGDAFTGTTVFNGETYTADKIPRLAADIYLAELAAKGWTPAYQQFADHENYYKLLADFRLVDAEGHYAPHRPVQFFIPETVPVRTVDGNGNARVERMPTEEYIKTELEKELRERDAIARDLADDSAEGIIPQFKKAIAEEQKTDFSAELDSTGRELTKGQQAYFADSKIRDKNGNLQVIYHGTEADFYTFDTKVSGGSHGNAEGFGIYLTDDPEVSSKYGERQIKGYANITRPAYGFRKTITQAELAKLIRAACEKEAAQMVADDEYDSVKDALPDTWVSNYVMTYEYASMRDVYAAVAEQIGRLNGNDADIVYEIMNANGIRDYKAAMAFYRDVLTPATGIDGIWQIWKNEETGQSSNIYLAFDSNQIKDVANENPTEDPDIRWSADLDQEYWDAVMSGDEEKQQKLVEQAAKAAGYTIKAYHGTDSKFTVFNKNMIGKNAGFADGPGFYFTTAKTSKYETSADTYGSNIIDAYLKINNPLSNRKKTVEKKEFTSIFHSMESDKGTWHKYVFEDLWDNANSDYELYSAFNNRTMGMFRINETDVINGFAEMGYDGVIVNLNNSANDTHYVVFSPEQIKSADPVTYDDDGNVIPLSERFNSEKEDIRWSADLESEAIDQLEETAERDPKMREQLQNVQALYNAYRKASRQKNGKIPTEAKLKDIVQKYVLNDPNNKMHRNEMTEEVIRLLNDVMDGNISFTSFAYAVRGMMQREAENAGHWERIKGDESQQAFIKEFRDGKKQRTLYLDAAAYDQVAKKYGGRNELRKATFPKLTLTTDEQAGAQTLGAFYDSLKERYNLPQAETPLEQLTNMLAKYKEDTRIWIDDDVSGNFGKSQEEVIDDMTTAFMTDVLESANVLNGVDTELYTARIAELRKEIDNVRRRRIEKVVSDAQAALRKQLDDIVEDESKTSDEVQAESQRATDTATREALVKAYEDRMRAYEAETRRSHQTEQERKDIRRRLRKMKDMLLKNTKTQNIPQPLKKTVKNIIIDFLGDEDIFTPLEREYIAKDLIRLKTPEVNGPTFDFTRFSDALRENYNQMKEDMKNAGQIFGVGMTLRDMTPIQVDITNAFVENVMYVVQNAGKTFLDNRNGNIFTDGERTIKDLRKMLEGMNEKQKKRTQELIRSMMNNDYMTSFYFFKEHMGGTFGEYFDAITTAESNEGLMLKQIETFFTALKKDLDYDKEKWDKQTHMLHLATYESRTEGNNPLPVISIDNWDVELTTEACMEVYAWYRREMMSGQESSHLVPYINEDNEIFGGGVVLDNDLIKAQGNLERAAQELKGQAKATRGNEEYQKFLKERGDAINVAADKNRHMLTEGAVEAIIGTLTDKQKAYVERVTDFLSNVMGEYGNEATMKWYGVRFFEEDYYFPYESPAEFSSRRYGLTNEKRLGNWGPTHRTQVYAHTPLVLSNFSEVAAKHAYEMATYSEFLIPIEQMTNLLSYSNLEGQDASIQSMIKSVYGDRAMSYINDFMNQINGGVKGDEADSFINRMTGKFKAGAVMANASVVIQQPSAIMRAGAIMNPSHFFKTIRNMGVRKADYQEMMNHSGVAVIKEIGGFDTDLGRGIAKTLSGKEGKMDKVNDFLGWGAEKADALTWTWIWNAVKHEVTEDNEKSKHEYVYDATNDRHRRIAQMLLRTNTELQEGTEAFDEAIKKELYLDDVRKRFEEVVHYTQVYDSVISKNRWMRSQSGLVKMVTAFMAEPTLSLNMLMMSGKNHRVHKGRAIAAFAANIMVNSILRSIVTMWRKRDEDETYFEAWLREMTGDLIGDYHVLFLDGAWSPFGMIPLVKDIISLVQGYDVERSDISVFGDVIEDMNDILDSVKANDKDITTWAYPKIDQLRDLAFDAAKIFGVPVGNIYRDGEGIYKMIAHWIQDPKWEIDGNALTEALKKGIGIEQSDEYRAYKGVLNNDTELIKRMTAPDEKTYNKLLGKGYNEEEAMKQAEYDAKDNFDKLCADGLIRYDPEERANRAAAYLISGTADGLKIYDELRQDMIDDGFSNNAVMKAINKCVNNLQPPEDKEAKEKEDINAYKMTYLDNAIEANDKAAFDHISNALKAQGKVQKDIDEEARDKITKMLHDEEIDMATASKMYQTFGGLNADKAEEKARDYATYLINQKKDKEGAYRILTDYAGKTDDEANILLDFYSYKDQHPDTELDAQKWEQYEKVYERVGQSFKEIGIAPETFESYYVQQVKCKGEDTDGDGKADNDSVKKQVLPIIDSLTQPNGTPLTKEQKDAIYLSRWAKANSSGISLQDAPWNKR